MKTKMDEFLAAFIFVPGKSTKAKFRTNKRANIDGAQNSWNVLGM
jgi:hypothetical protein